MVTWRGRVRALPSALHLSVPTLNDHIPGWIAELATTLRVMAPVEPLEGSPAIAIPFAHGVQRFEDGFDIEEVVDEYSLLRDCVHELAERLGVVLQGPTRRAVDICFDDAIGRAVKAFAESQAREVQRRRAEHLAFIAHDLRTPLSAINLSAHILQRKAATRPPDPENDRALKTLVRNTVQLDTLVSGVLKENTHVLAELSVRVERRSFDLWPLVESLMQDLHPIASKSATLLINEVPDDLVVCADAGLVRRILQNLLSNAIGYAPGGRIVMGARDLAPADSVECWVTDNGVGISPERIGQVFETLETDPQRDGLGLGLAIVKTFVEAHDGRVTVQSVEGEGATFRFTLPRVAANDAAPSPATPALA